MPETPSSVTIGKSTRESPIASCLSPPGSPNRPMIHGAKTMNSAVSPERMSRTSQKRLDATRHARFLSPFSSSSVNTGTNADWSAASATRARTRFGT